MSEDEEKYSYDSPTPVVSPSTTLYTVTGPTNAPAVTYTATVISKQNGGRITHKKIRKSKKSRRCSRKPL